MKPVVASPNKGGCNPRRILLAAGIVTVFGAASAKAQVPPPTHVYELNGSLADTLGGPSLVASGSGVLGATGYTVAAHDSGLSLTGAMNPLSYSIEMVIRIDPYPDPELCNWAPYVCSLKALDSQDRT
ncbi:MAG TPA: hypothetical protein VGB99_08145, partial [Acidobacteriota bacterium]